MVPVIKEVFVKAWKENLTTVSNQIVLPISFKRQEMTVQAGNRKFIATAQKPMYEIGLMSTVYKQKE